MDLKKAEILIEKYYNGETSPEEELQLREFFRTAETIPEHLMPEKELFTLYSEAANEELPATGFMENLEKVIDDQALIRNGVSKSVNYWISGIAAGIALLFVSYLLIVHRPAGAGYGSALQDTYQDPRLAYEETQKVLLYISQTMNKGTAQLTKVSKLNKPVQSLQNLKKLDTGLSKLELLQLLNDSEKNNKIK
ncbi:MAG TPA: hypothetical protein VJ346_02225 [Bacteroidales bacterium]|nr:hypothetical protein [Bacteroidales bacterium]